MAGDIKEIGAIIGCGPSGKELTDPAKLMESRYVIAMNAAAANFPSHAVLLVSTNALYRFWPLVGERTVIGSQWQLDRLKMILSHNRTPGLEQTPFFRDGFDRRTKPPLFRPMLSSPVIPIGWDMSLTYALKFFFEDLGIRNVELYGVDFDEPKYAMQQRSAECYLRIAAPWVTVLQCCPSSPWCPPPITIAERPWCAPSSSDPRKREKPRVRRSAVAPP